MNVYIKRVFICFIEFDTNKSLNTIPSFWPCVLLSTGSTLPLPLPYLNIIPYNNFIQLNSFSLPPFTEPI
jgi:hypothetical protein